MTDSGLSVKRDRVSLVLSGFGQLLISVGVLLLLLVVYQLWWTNVVAANATSRVADDLVTSWGQPLVPPPAPVDPSPSPTTPSPSPPEPLPPSVVEVPEGQAFALLYIPRMINKVNALPVMQGVGLDVLAEGAGHYPGTAAPGTIGNFAVAAHRATHNEPFRDIDTLRVGDLVHVRTRDTWFTYTLQRDKIVQPTDTWVVQPVPGKPSATATQALITLTTCNPRWASYERWIWWGELISIRAATAGPPPDLVAAIEKV